VQRESRKATMQRLEQDAARRREQLQRLKKERAEEDRILQLELKAGQKVKELQVTPTDVVA
jgi:hypothetical protein